MQVLSLGYTLKELTVLNIRDVDTKIKKKSHQHEAIIGESLAIRHTLAKGENR